MNSAKLRNNLGTRIIDAIKYIVNKDHFIVKNDDKIKKLEQQNSNLQSQLNIEQQKWNVLFSLDDPLQELSLVDYQNIIEDPDTTEVERMLAERAMFYRAKVKAMHNTVFNQIRQLNHINQKG